MSRIPEICELIREDNPGIELFSYHDGKAIGYGSAKLGRIQVLVAETLTGAWAPMPELLVNGEPLFKQSAWEKVTL